MVPPRSAQRTESGSQRKGQYGWWDNAWAGRGVAEPVQKRRSGLPRGMPAFEAPQPSRSRNMAAIRSKDTKPELVVRRALHSAGFRFRLHRKDIPGSPDLVLPRYRRAVLVHGCFWHGHTCPAVRVPKHNTDYWLAKTAMNKGRDERAIAALEAAGWEVTVIWQCELLASTAALIDLLRSQRSVQT